MKETTKVLCLGDSLTAGNLGVSWLEIFKAEHRASNFELINAGEDGYTMAGLESRLNSFLEKGEIPDILILEGGANDILLPHMQSIGKSWDPFIRKLLRHGSRPASSLIEFEQTLKEIITLAGNAGISRICCCTIPCLGEDPGSPLNLRREEYNGIIRNVSPCLADTALAFETVLKSHSASSPYLFKTPDDLYKDSLVLQKFGESELCGKRKLHLTIDGAHLNRRGAQLFAETIAISLSLAHY